MGIEDGCNNKMATFVLKGQLLEIKIEEGGTYRADVRIKLQLMDSTNTLVWKSVILGESNRWGKTFVKEMYNETMCNAIIECVEKLLKNDKFITIITHKSP